MTSKRETVLAALHTALESGVTPTIARNDPLPTTVPNGALVIMFDGDPGEPEVSMSPLTYHYDHVVEVVVIVQARTGRDAALDAVLVEIGAAAIADRTLGGLAEFVEPQAPVLDDQAVYGGETIKAATVPIIVTYGVTADPLS